MIQRLKNRLISTLSLKSLLLILFNALMFAAIFAAFALAYEQEEALDTSNIDKELDGAGSSNVFDSLFNKLGKSSDSDQDDSEIQDSEIRIHESTDNGSYLGSARINIIDKTLGKLYAVDIPTGSAKSVNEITVRVSKCWAPNVKTLVKEGRALVEISESKNKVINRMFKGWIYAHSQAASQLVHPKYDVSLAYCFNSAAPQAEPENAAESAKQPKAKNE